MRATLKIYASLLILTIILVNLNVVSQAHHQPQSTCYVSVRVTIVDPANLTITVDQNGSGDYKAIQEAINNAPANSTIYIKKGVYREIIVINKPITLIGEDKNKTVINPVSEQNKYAVYISKPGVTIKNMSITNGGDGLYTMGIQIVSPSTRLENIKVYDVPIGVGIWSSNNLITNSTFQGNTDEGIALLGTSSSPVKNNSIINCIFQNNTDGIELQYASNNKISSCRFLNNSHDGISAIASENNNNTIINCRIYNNRAHGIYVAQNSVGNRVIDCSVLGNGINLKGIQKTRALVERYRASIVGVDIDGDGIGDVSLHSFFKGFLTGKYALSELKYLRCLAPN